MANTPREFNTQLLDDSSNNRRKAVYSSKGVGEVTAFLGSAVHFALLNAVQAAREDAGFSMAFKLDTPATVRGCSLTFFVLYSNAFSLCQQFPKIIPYNDTTQHLRLSLLVHVGRAKAERVRLACLDGIVQSAARGLEATQPIV
eukprot:COSAG02_NODE_5265_length_4486_cov_2.841577_3_plen_144_part_00